jgi:hypothetical protein
MKVINPTHVAFSIRFNLLLDHCGIRIKGDGRQYELSKIFKVSNKAAWNWISGNAIPRMEMLTVILNYFHRQAPVGIEWLLSGNPVHAPTWLADNEKGLYTNDAIIKSGGNEIPKNKLISMKSVVTQQGTEYAKLPIANPIPIVQNANSSQQSTIRELKVMSLHEISKAYNVNDPGLIHVLGIILQAHKKDDIHSVYCDIEETMRHCRQSVEIDKQLENIQSG